MPKTAAEWQQMNDPVIAEFRAKGGRTSRKYPVILVTTTGARTGKERVSPLNFSIDGDRLVVIASKGGSPTHPSWYLNLVANPEVTIEHGGEIFRARASTATEPERTRLFDQQAAEMPFFDGYRKRVHTPRNPGRRVRADRSREGLTQAVSKDDPVAAVNAYLAAQPADVRAALEDLRRVIRAAAPHATELISYQVPAFRDRYMLVSYGATRSHCSFFVMSTAVMEAHAAELAGYDLGKGTIRFTPSKPLPAALVTKLVKARVAENERREQPLRSAAPNSLSYARQDDTRRKLTSDSRVSRATGRRFVRGRRVSRPYTPRRAAPRQPYARSSVI